jgi:hypothetical protein
VCAPLEFGAVAKTSNESELGREDEVFRERGDSGTKVFSDAAASTRHQTLLSFGRSAE